MARIEFGHTWWGKRWLDALTGIDFENRLPRGKRYARNGSIRTIEIESIKVAAKVQGRTPSPYRVGISLWKFSNREKDTIIATVKQSPYFLSQLQARKLPSELEEELNKAGIRLFPSSWKDLKMHCSCPDWAVPCKHLAAVVYTIANEIDKNPFMVFLLHDLDLLEAISGSEEDEEITGFEALIAASPREYNYYREKLEHIDLALIPELSGAVKRLLTPFPLFYLQKDFKELFSKSADRLSREMKRHIRNLEIREEEPETLYTSCKINFHKNRYHYTGHLKKGDREIRFDSDNCSPLVEYLQLLSAGDLSQYPPTISFLIILHSFVLKLIEKRGVIPEILSFKKNSYIVRWIPALFSTENRNILEALTLALPQEMVRYGSSVLEHREQILFLFSLFVQHYLRLFDPVKSEGESPILELFYRGAEYSSQRFEERENGRTIHLWLGRFFIRPEHFYPVIKIEEPLQDRFTFAILVGDTREEGELPLSFSRFLERPEQETLPMLRDLSLLATYLPTVDDFLRRCREDGALKEKIEVDGRSFIEDWFAALEVLNILGVKTLVPKVLREAFQPQLSLAIKGKTSTASDGNIVSYLSLRNMLEFDWSIATGNQFIPPEELFELSGRYGKFVRHKEMFLQLDEKDLAAISRHLTKPPQPSPLALLKTALTGSFEGAPIRMDEAGKKLVDQLLTPPEAELPKGLQATLRPYQERGYRWIYHNYRIGLGSLVADDMGLGKTLQVISFLLRLKNEEEVSGKKPVLVVAPASLLSNWVREIRRFAPDLRAETFHGPQRSLPADTDIVITTYATARSDNELLSAKGWSVLVIDEAQNIKNSGSSQSKAVKSIKAGFHIAMTGTPVENRLLDYWSIIDFVMKGYLGTKKSFKESFAVPIERFRDQSALERFRLLTAPLILRRLKTDKSIINDLPEKMIKNQYPVLSKQQTALYKDVVNRTEEWLEGAEGIERSGAVFKLMTALKQICCHPWLYAKGGGKGPELSGKAEMLIELLTTISERGEKTLIFTQYTEMGGLLQEMIEDHFQRPCLFLHGGSSRKERDRMVDAIQNDREYRFMILSIKAGGVGLNLTAANHVVHYDLWWNPAVENQATDRAFRIGQQKNVAVYRLVTKGTFEDKIDAMLRSKEELAELSVRQGEQWLTKLGDRDLKALLEIQA